MLKSRKCARVLAILLSAATLLQGSAAATSLDSAFSYSYTIADKSSYTRVEGMDSSGSLQKANYIEYTPGTSVKPMIVYAKENLFGSKSTINTATSFLQTQGYTVLGGINADFFVLGSSIPIGLVIRDGRLVSSDAWQHAVGFRADGSAVMGQPSSTMKLEGASGAVWISYFNKTRTAAGLYLLNSDFDSQTHISTNGKSIVLERVDDTPVTIGGQVKMRVIAKGAGSASTTIAANQMVLTMDDRCKATWVDYPIGEELTLTVNATDPKWQEVDYAVGGKNLLTNGTPTVSGIDGGSSKAPRTAVAMKDDGTVMLYEIDGRQSAISAGLTASALAAELKSLGYTNAVCLDGGGSSILNVRIPGEDKLTVVSSPSDGSQRAVANYIFLVNTAKADGAARNVHMRPSTYYVLPGASTYFTAWASDSSYAPASLPEGISYTASSGTVDSAAQIFTSDVGAPGNTTLTASSADGTVAGTHTICVTPAVNTIKLEDNGTALTAIALRGGKTIDVNAKLFHQGTQMASKDELLTWTVTGDIGTVDANGLFTANQSPASGKLTCSYGSVSTTIAVAVGLSDPQQLTTISDFETTQPFTGDTDTTLTRVTGASAARGTGALSVSFGDKGDTHKITVPPVAVGSLTTLSLWAQANTATMQLTALFTDEGGATQEAPLTALGASGSYTQLSATIPAGAASFIGLSVTGGENGTLLLDHILMSQRLVNNTDAPAIVMTAEPTTVAADAAATVAARITMEGGKYVLRAANVAAYVDGVKSTAAYDPASQSITVKTGALATGLHQVTIEAIDDAGNRARRSLSIMAGTATTSSFSDTASNWANGHINFAASRGVIKGETKNGKTSFYPQRNLTRNEFAVIMARYLKLDTSGEAVLPFADASAIPSWSSGAISACVDAGVMDGQLNTKTGKTNFNPNANITRAEVMTVISKSLPRGFVGVNTSFADSASIAAWADPHVRYTVAADVIGGYADGTIRPNALITRAEIAKIICSLY